MQTLNHRTFGLMGGSEAGRKEGTIERRSGREGARRKSNMVFEAKVEAKTNAGRMGPHI